ncbi:MAG TPA: hypothetical protein VKU39_21750 [Streptosporangiaceae bacterium]|nr:hypothetical protein [Streptosporangiaceae bacterium]
MATVPPFGELIAATTTSAVHLEMRDTYTPDDQRFRDWLAGDPLPAEADPGWSALVRAHTARGVRFRRARLVSEPLAAFIRFEYEATAAVNVAAGEEVRWLPRRKALDLCVPVCDYWVFDSRLVRFHHFSGDGDIIQDELSDDPAVVAMCAGAFEAVWERAIPHAAYRPE